MASAIGSITSIGAPRLASPLQAGEATRPATAPTGDPFGKAVAQALNSLQTLQGQADSAAVDMVSGGQTELHDVMIAAEQASLGFQLTLQLRNKVVDAYQEIMRMQV
jgi:flagellar hook-basal body complex protein FliE